MRENESVKETGIIGSNLTIGYDKAYPVARDLDCRLMPGEVTALIGRNGCGKSTLLKTLTGSLPTIKGSVMIDGECLTQISGKHLAKQLSLVTTDRGMTGGLRVEELVSLGRHPHTGYLGRMAESDKEIVHKAMNDTGVLHKRESFVADLSDGERQKVMIARALAQQSPYLIMDEPFSFLDVSARIGMLKLLKEIAANRNTGIMFSTHDVSQALRMADRVILFTDGKQLISGSPAELIETGDIDKLFDNRDVVFDETQMDFVARS